MISPILSASKTRTVFRRVVAMYYARLLVLFEPLIVSHEQKARLKDDVQFFRKELTQLNGLHDPGDELALFVEHDLQTCAYN
jgi:hypothetical protein